MSYKTVEVELENGWVRASSGEMLPAKAHALLTILGPTGPEPPTHSELSLADLAAGFKGIGKGIHTDLSTNKRHLDDLGR